MKPDFAWILWVYNFTTKEYERHPRLFKNRVQAEDYAQAMRLKQYFVGEAND